MCQPEPTDVSTVVADAQLTRLPALRLAGPLCRKPDLDLGCLASLLSSEPAEFAQLLLPRVQKHAVELELLATANAFPQSGGAAKRHVGADRCPTGKELIQQYLC